MIGTPRRIAIAASVMVLLAAAAWWLLTPRAKDVATIAIREAPAERVLAVNGRIRPRAEVAVRPQLGGELVELPFDVGDRVTAGQIIARLDTAPETAAIEQAQAAVAAQQAVLAQARRDLARFEALGQFASRREVEQRRLAVTEGLRELDRRAASVVQARELRDRRILRAPFAGVILERPVDPGQTVGADTIVYRMADLSSPEITAEVDEIYATEIRTGTAALISLPGQARQYPARVLHVEPRVDPATGARDVRLALGDGTIDAPSGLTATVNLVIERRQRAISIPRSAITGSSVLVVGKDAVVASRPITFIDWPAEQVIITAGLAAGDRILADPAAARPGEKVRAAN